MSRKILITGASGFVGSHLVEKALSEGYEVYAGIRINSRRENLNDQRINFFPFDSTDKKGLEAELQKFADTHGGFDAVIHCAAVTRPRSIEEFHEGNTVFTEFFAQLLKEKHPSLRQFIFISSLAAQGPGPRNLSRISETSAPTPLTPYGKSKLEGEKRLMELSDFPWVIIRPAAVYGPRDEKFLLRVIRTMQMGWAVKLGSRRQKQSFIYINDLISAVFEVMRRGVKEEIFLLADGEGYSQDEFYALLKEKFDLRPIPVRIPRQISIAIGFVSRLYARLAGRPLHLSHHKMREITADNWYVDISKAQALLDFQPAYDLDKGIDAFYNWYKANISDSSGLGS